MVEEREKFPSPSCIVESSPCVGAASVRVATGVNVVGAAVLSIEEEGDDEVDVVVDDEAKKDVKENPGDDAMFERALTDDARVEVSARARACMRLSLECRDCSSWRSPCVKVTQPPLVGGSGDLSDVNCWAEAVVPSRVS